MLTVTQLITDAYNLAGIVSPEFEVVRGDQLSSGLRKLNSILDEASLDSVLIPYFSHVEFNAVPGQQIYEIPNLIELTSLTFNINNVRFPMIRDSLNRYFATGRVDDINSLPFHYYVEQELIGSRIYLYFNPQSNYPMKITGKFSIEDLTLNDDVNLFYAPYYSKWLTYRLAAELCELYGIACPPATLERLKNLERRLNQRAGEDLTIDKYRFISRPAINDLYGQANIGKGWTIP